MSEHDTEPRQTGSERQLRQGDLPVHPDRPLEPPADGVTILPSNWDVEDVPVHAELEEEPKPDPVRDAILAEDWPAAPG